MNILIIFIMCLSFFMFTEILGEVLGGIHRRLKSNSKTSSSAIVTRRLKQTYRHTLILVY